MTKSQTPEGVTLTLIKTGEKIATGRNKTISLVGQTFEVTTEDGTVLGTVARVLFTRERKTPGKTYVNARWQAPAWGYSLTKGGRYFESFSKAAAVEDLIHARSLRK